MAKKESKKEKAARRRQEDIDKRVMDIVSLGAFVFAVVGIICFALGYRNISAMCAVITVLNTLMQLIVSGQRDFGAELIFVFLGALVARIFKQDLFQCIVLALCIGDAAVQLFTWLSAPILAYYAKNNQK